MKYMRLLLMTLCTVLSSIIAMGADYVVDFNTRPDNMPSSNMAAPTFSVASGWTRLAMSAPGDGYGPYYMMYSYSQDGGVNHTGCLIAMQQEAPQSSYDGQIIEVKDYLITPKISGTVTIQVKGYQKPDKSYLRAYKTIDNPKSASDVGDQITVRITNSSGNTVSTYNENNWYTASFEVTEPTRIALRLQYVAIDNFTVSGGSAEKAKGLSFVSAEPSATTGLIKWVQQPNGKVLVKYEVKVKNSGELTLTEGDDGYSVSIFNNTTKEVIGTTPVPQTLEPGEISDAFDVKAEIDPWSGGYPYFFLRENVTNNELSRAWSTYEPYAPNFVFRKDKSEATSSLSDAQSYGMITSDSTCVFEIYNSGNAPLVIKSVALPNGFTSSDVPTAEFTLDKQQGRSFGITLPATNKGNYSGTLSVVYLDRNSAEQTYSLDFSGSVVSANTWSATFDNRDPKLPLWPQGSVAENGITTDYTYRSGAYDIFLKSYTATSYATENNKFITPLLHASAGDVMTFDAKRVDSGDNYFLRVYTSTDRKNWGEPVLEAKANTMETNFQNYSITFATEGNYYVAFAIYGTAVDNIIGLEQVAVAHDLYFKEVKLPSEVESGQAVNASIELIPLTNEVASDYYVAYMIDGDTVATAESIDLEASTTASSSKRFAISYKPTMGGTHVSKIGIFFKDGTKFFTDEQQLTIVYEPELRFCNADATEGYYGPTPRSGAIEFGRVSNSEQAQEFKLYNWGAAPLKVKSITVPEGFTTNIDKADVASKKFVPLIITFSATVAGKYEGELKMIYEDGNGNDQTFTQSVSGIRLDETLFYASFDGKEGGVWPNGSLHERNMSLVNGGTYNHPDYYLTSSSDTLNYVITPKLMGKKGDKLQFDVRQYSAIWEGNIKVYAAQTRESLIEGEGQLLLEVKTEDMSVEETRTFAAALPEDGEYYLSMVIANRPYVDNLYGLKLVPIDHDIAMSNINIPAEAMQNVLNTVSVSLLNLGLEDETVNDYEMTVYVDGKPVNTVSQRANLPMATMPSDKPTTVMMGYRYNRTGEFPVKVEFKADNFIVYSSETTVTFVAEEPQTTLAIGTADGTTSDAPLNLNYKMSESVMLYNAATLAAYGLKPGDKINAITFRGYKTSDQMESSIKVAYQWTDDQLQAIPTSAGAYEGEAMIQAMSNDQFTWEVAGTPNQLADMIVITFEQPLVYEEGKSLRLHLASTAIVSKIAFFEKSTIAEGCFEHQTDGSSFDNAWKSAYLPVIQLSLEDQSIKLTGTVTSSKGLAIAGAKLTITSLDSDSIRYETTSNESGNYEISIIQGLRSYQLEVTAAEYRDTVISVPATSNNSFNIVLKPLKDEDEESSIIETINANESVITVYDLQGRRVKQPKKGLYIINGKKALLKK